MPPDYIYLSHMLLPAYIVTTQKPHNMRKATMGDHAVGT